MGRNALQRSPRETPCESLLRTHAGGGAARRTDNVKVILKINAGYSDFVKGKLVNACGKFIILVFFYLENGFSR